MWTLVWSAFALRTTPKSVCTSRARLARWPAGPLLGPTLETAYDVVASRRRVRGADPGEGSASQPFTFSRMAVMVPPRSSRRSPCFPSHPPSDRSTRPPGAHLITTPEARLRGIPAWQDQEQRAALGNLDPESEGAGKVPVNGDQRSVVHDGPSRRSGSAPGCVLVLV